MTFELGPHASWCALERGATTCNCDHFEREGRVRLDQLSRACAHLHTIELAREVEWCAECGAHRTRTRAQPWRSWRSPERCQGDQASKRIDRVIADSPCR